MKNNPCKGTLVTSLCSEEIFGSQIIEQLRMRRTLAHHAEIAGRIDNPVSKMMLPDPVRHHACCQWMLNDRIGQLQSPATLRKWQWITVGLAENRGESTRDFLAQR